MHAHDHNTLLRYDNREEKVPYDVRPPTHPSIHPLIHQRNWLSMSILLVEASLHLSLAPFFPLTIHPSHHSSLSPSPLSPFTPFIDLLVACFGKKSLTSLTIHPSHHSSLSLFIPFTIHLSHHSNYRSGYTPKLTGRARVLSCAR